MSYPILLQGWVTIRGNTTGTVVTQQETDYVDLTPFKDLVAFTEATQISGGIKVNLQTAPTRDNGFLAAAETRFTPIVGVTTTLIRYADASKPLTRYLRWQLSAAAASAWSITFRIWLACNMSGNYRRIMHVKQHQMQRQREAQLAMLREALKPTEPTSNKPCGCAAGSGGSCNG